MPQIETFRLDKKNVVLVEGDDDCYFFRYFFKFLNLTSFQLIGCGGKDNLFIKIKALRNQEKFSNLSNLIIIQDNDAQPTQRLIKIGSDLHKAGLDSIPTAPYRDIGTAAQHGAWDFGDPKFNHLKEFFCSIETS